MTRWLGGFVLLLVSGCGSSSDDEPMAHAGASAAGASSAGASNEGGSAPSDAGASDAGASDAGASNAGSANAGASNAGASNAGSAGAAVAPDTTWVNCTGDLPMVAPANAGEVQFLSAEPNTNRVIAGLGAVGLWVSDNSGKNWTHLGSGAGSAAITHGPLSLVYDPDHAGVFWESGIYGSFGDGIHTTSDAGLTFKQLGTIGHNDYVSIDFTDPERQTLLAGSHEASQKLYKSTDGGMSWTDIGKSVPAGFSFSSLPLIIDTETYLLGVSGYGGGTWGVLRSTDGGMGWTAVSTEGPYGWPLRASDGSLYWQIRSQGMITSTDQGSTWSKCGAGPIQMQSAGPLQLPDGRIITLGQNHAIVSDDKCKTWKEIGETLPFPNANCKTYGFTYSVALKTLFINHNECLSKLIPDSIWSSGFDYTKD